MPGKQFISRARIENHGEVFTSDKEVHAMLDLVKEETNRIESKFLEPACGTGNFLVELLRRRLSIVSENFLQGTIEYELVSLFALSAIYGIDILEDNVKACRRRLLKAFTQSNINNLQSAESILKQNILCADALTARFEQIHFDVIIGNPPYQLSDGGARKSAGPLYQKFVERGIRLNPHYLTMIIPARWYNGGKGLHAFRQMLLHDEHISELHDFPDTADCFPGLNIRGGICYFLWDRDHRGNCKIITHRRNDAGIAVSRPLLEDGLDIFIRYNESISILKKVLRLKEKPFSDMVSTRKPFGLATNFTAFSKNKNDILLYLFGEIGYVSKNEIKKNHELLNAWKIFVPYSSPGDDSYPHLILSRPIVAGPNTCCTETYLVVGPFKNEQQARNVAYYMTTTFFRFMLLLAKSTQHITHKNYAFVPLLNFEEKWTDEKLFTRYEISSEEVIFMRTLIKPM